MYRYLIDQGDGFTISNDPQGRVFQTRSAAVALGNKLARQQANREAQKRQRSRSSGRITLN